MRQAQLSWLFFYAATLLLAGLAAAEPMPATVGGHDRLRQAVERLSSERMMQDIVTLSGPEFHGRQTGTLQDETSGRFVANQFAAIWLHLTPSPDHPNQMNAGPEREWTQAGPISVHRIEEHPVLKLSLSHDHSSLLLGPDFLPILDSPPADIRAPIIFVGYGLVNPDLGYDEYAGVDVRNAIVLFLRGKPDGYLGPSAHADKERIAKTKGAAGYLTTTGPLLTAYERKRGVTGRPSAFYSHTPDPDRLPGAWVSTEIAEAIVQSGVPGENSLRQLQEEIARTKRSRSRTTKVMASLQWNGETTNGTLYNIASLIRGSSQQADDTIIIGAHRDHFGRQAGLLFGGADDNASGTAILLEVARVLAEFQSSLKRSILFLSFSGEEQGLVGSRLYTAQPIAPLSKTVAMINIDHAGVGNGRLTVGLTGVDTHLALEAGRLAGLANQLDLFGFFPGGDHVPFKEGGVPTVTVVSGGVHPHYHQPTDTADTINADILRSVARYVLALVWMFANAD